VEKATKKVRNEKVTGDDDVPADVLGTVGRRWSQNNDTSCKPLT